MINKKYNHFKILLVYKYISTWKYKHFFKKIKIVWQIKFDLFTKSRIRIKLVKMLKYLY